MQDNDQTKFTSLAYALNGHYVGHFIRSYRLFKGDLESCIILGEIAFYNAQNVFSKSPSIELDADEVKHLLKGCNAYSISMSTGIPRETVRRKVKKLEKMGYVDVDDKNQIVITKKPRIEFADFTKETLSLFLEFIEKNKNDIF